MSDPTFPATPGIYLLSVLEPHANNITEGRKRWEFRQNPNFGRVQEEELRPGDCLFIIAMGSIPTITCHCLVGRILRGQDMRTYFSAYQNKGWHEAGIHDTEDDGRLKLTILNEYATAVELTSTPLPCPIPVERIRHKHTKASWSGKGFTPVTMLHRYELDGMDLREALGKLLNVVG